MRADVCTLGLHDVTYDKPGTNKSMSKHESRLCLDTRYETSDIIARFQVFFVHNIISESIQQSLFFASQHQRPLGKYMSWLVTILWILACWKYTSFNTIGSKLTHTHTHTHAQRREKHFFYQQISHVSGFFIARALLISLSEAKISNGSVPVSQGRRKKSVLVCIYMYIYIYICIF
jgi:hypothetical protein